MKNSLILFLSIFFLFITCGKKNINAWKLEKSPIVDYNQSREFYQNYKSVSASLERQKKQTLFIVNNKLIDYEKFIRLSNEEKIINVKIIEDSIEIKKMDYSYNKVKKIIIADKK